MTGPHASAWRHPSTSWVLFLFPFPAVHFPLRPRLPSASPPFLICFTIYSSSSCCCRLLPSVRYVFFTPLPPSASVVSACFHASPRVTPSTDLSSAPSLTNCSHGEQINTKVVGDLPFNYKSEQAILVKNTFPKVEINVFTCKLVYTYHLKCQTMQKDECRWWKSPHPLFHDECC